MAPTLRGSINIQTLVELYQWGVAQIFEITPRLSSTVMMRDRII